MRDASKSVKARRRWTRPWPILLGLVLWAQAAFGDQRVARVDAIRTTDHARFVEELRELHRDETGLSAGEKRYLRFLDGWQANYEGRYREAEATFREVIAQSGREPVGTRATALLMTNLGQQGKYAEAYAIATRAANSLPDVTDPLARFVLLGNLAQMLTFAGQPGLGLTYANLMLDDMPAGQSRCQALVEKVSALEGSHVLTSRSPELLETIDLCAGEHQPVFSNAMSLVIVDRLIDEHKPAEAWAVLERMTPAVVAGQYFPHLIALPAARARIYEAQGKAADARKAALEAVAMSHAGDINEPLRIAYSILYSLEKAQGHASSTLHYYEQYVVQDQAHLHDVTVRSAAYEAATQDFRNERLQTEGLNKQNRILRLQQSLDAKSVETSRLYIALMTLVLLSIMVWAARIKRSQLRFKRLSTYDGLTGIFHHQHFMGEAAGALAALQKRSGAGCLLSLDLDHFKRVNDTHGHAVGDAALLHAVAICQTQLRKGDLLGRLGGEEFGMLLMDTSLTHGSAVAERIRLALADSPLLMDGAVVSFSASIGVACTTTRGYDLQSLCRASDASLYEAKRSGRDRVVVDGNRCETNRLA